jgi:hypothetical protein
MHACRLHSLLQQLYWLAGVLKACRQAGINKHCCDSFSLCCILLAPAGALSIDSSQLFCSGARGDITLRSTELSELLPPPEVVAESTDCFSLASWEDAAQQLQQQVPRLLGTKQQVRHLPRDQHLAGHPDQAAVVITNFKQAAAEWCVQS